MIAALFTPFLLIFQAGSVKAMPNPPATLYDLTVSDIDGKSVRLDKYKGRALLIVNTASRCGLTPQYEGLQALYAKYKEKGLVVLGFPANDFNGQEPGTNAEIKQFCALKYKVEFPMFSKISVKGEQMHPLYRWLITKNGRLDPVEWNFAKFLVSKDGKSVERFDSRLAPGDSKLIEAIESALK